MKFVEVDHIPNHTKTKMKPVREILESFLSSDIKYAKAVFEEGEYSVVSTAWNSLYQACYKYNLPIQVTMRGGDVYLIRTDM